MKVCLDAGHYGKYNQSPANKLYYESEVMWKLHLMLKARLEEYGIEVITTRTNQANDLAPYDRGVKARGCDLFISLHSNAVASSVNDSIDYPVSYCAVNGTADGIGLVLAKAIQNTIPTKQAARIEHRSGNNGDYYGVLRGATVVGAPALILEHSFHTHTASTNWLLDEHNLENLAIAEAWTIAEYYGIEIEYKSGWKEENGGWRFYLGDTGEYIANAWYPDGGKWYWFDGAGMMVTSAWYMHKGHWYYLGADGAMAKGLLKADGKWYFTDADGALATEPVTLTPDRDGALHYPGIEN